MPLVAAAVCPHPPLLIPEVASGAAVETEDLRDAAQAALARLWAAAPDGLLLVGTGTQTRRHLPSASGSLAGWGVPVEVALAGGVPVDRPTLPLSLTVGAWLLAGEPPVPVLGGLEVALDTPAAECLALGRAEVAGHGGRLALLVMGDGSACRSESAPGYLDPRAEPFDTAVTRALRDVDLGALAGFDPALAAELLVAGRAAWQVLAGAAGPATGLRGEVLYDAAPYGVAYTVAAWT